MSLIQNKIQPAITTNITYNHQYTSATTTLANAQPATPNFSYTISAGNLPSFSVEPALVGYWGRILAGGQNNDTGNRTVNYRIELVRGGVTTAAVYGSASVLTATKTWCLNAGVLSANNVLLNCAPVVGDVINTYIWSDSTANVTLTKYGLEIFPGAIFPVNNTNRLLINTGIVLGSDTPSGYSYLGGTNAYPLKFVNTSTTHNIAAYGNSNFNANMTNLAFDGEHPTLGLLDHPTNRSPFSQMKQNASQYVRNAILYPTQIVYSPTNIIKGGNLI